jgi:hypothetical protein
MNEQTIQVIGLDVQTNRAKAVVRALRRLKSTVAVEEAGAYREAEEYCQIYVRTTKTEEELDGWADGTKLGQFIVGFFTVSESRQRELFG